jgi:hypothetical protein
MPVPCQHEKYHEMPNHARRKSREKEEVERVEAEQICVCCLRAVRRR